MFCGCMLFSRVWRNKKLFSLQIAGCLLCCPSCMLVLVAIMRNGCLWLISQLLQDLLICGDIFLNRTNGTTVCIAFYKTLFFLFAVMFFVYEPFLNSTAFSFVQKLQLNFCLLLAKSFHNFTLKFKTIKIFYLLCRLLFANQFEIDSIQL